MGMTLRHKNIVQVLGIYHDDVAPYILMPWMENGNVRKCAPAIMQGKSYSSSLALGFVNSWVRCTQSLVVSVLIYRYRLKTSPEEYNTCMPNAWHMAISEA